MSGIRQVEVRSWDADGNRGSFRFEIEATASGEPATELAWVEEETQFGLRGPNVDRWELVSGDSRVHVSGSEFVREWGALPSPPWSVEAFDSAGASLLRRDWDAAIGGRSIRRSLLGTELQLEDRSGQSLFSIGALVLGLAPDFDPPEELTATEDAWELRSAATAFRGEFTVSIDRPLDAKEAFFLRSARGSWSMLGWKDRQKGSSRLSGGGLLAILRDVKEPSIGSWRGEDGITLSDGAALLPRSKRERDGVELARWPSLLLPLSDAGAGLEAAGIVATLDGVPFPARWDPEEDYIAFDFFVDPGPGLHEARIEARDRLGNLATAELSFELLER
jgi:hypothetical protein